MCVLAKNTAIQATCRQSVPHEHLLRRCIPSGRKIILIAALSFIQQMKAGGNITGLPLEEVVQRSGQREGIEEVEKLNIFFPIG